MSSPLLWILSPALLGVGLLFYRGKYQWLPTLIAGIACLLLAWIAWQLPIGVVMRLGTLNLEISPSLVVLGRSFTLGSAHTPLLTLLYLFQALWLFGGYLARPGALFTPLTLIGLALLVAALAVQPFLYAALLICMAALLLIPALLREKARPGLGLQRYLQFQVFAVPFILFTGWILSGVEANPSNTMLVLRASMLLALGFGFLLALFPFHSWIPLLGGESHPYVFGYTVFFLPATGMIFALSFFDRYAWLREANFSAPLLLAGGLMALLGGLWAAHERQLGRMFGYAAVLLSGYCVQAIGLGGAAGVQALFALLIGQGLAVWAWATALSRLPQQEATTPEGLTAQAPSQPLTITVLLVALASLAGLPLLGVFHGRLAVLDETVVQAPWAALAALAGSLGLLAAGYRLLAATLAAQGQRAKGWVEEAQPADNSKSSDLQHIYIWGFAAFSAILLFGSGLFPQLFLGAVPELAALFSQLMR
ncbi:MAG: hypothetical protein KIT46_07190 [Anaerolineales bacterium]|nr:hypothetical protein [Anaerolineales bacterium]MCW5855812.1 hypothetical protein [Anaerolineales bacterium]